MGADDMDPSEQHQSPLARIREELEATKARAIELAAGLSVVEFNERPRPGGWSISECFSHLVATGEAYLKPMEAALDASPPAPAAAPAPSDGRLPLALWERFFIWLMEPPPKLKMPVPAVFAPSSHLAERRVLPPYLAIQDRLIAALDRAVQLGALRTRIVSPASRSVKPSLAACFAILAAHERRHLWQAELVREEVLAHRMSEAARAMDELAPEESTNLT